MSHQILLGAIGAIADNNIMATESQKIDQLRNDLARLKQQNAVVALKTGTEVEDMTFEEIAFMQHLCQDIVPLIVKIGGPEARNDIRGCLEIGVTGILAPMVETVYALTNFIGAMNDVVDSSHHQMPYLAINLESMTAVANLDAMIHSTAFKKLQQVTIGRGDLSSSMHLEVDDDEVIDASRHAVRKIQNQGLVTSVGGGLKIGTIKMVVERIPADRVNTRHTVLENSKVLKRDPQRHLYQALRFERDIYRTLYAVFPNKRLWYEKRIEILSERMGQLEVIEKVAKS